MLRPIGRASAARGPTIPPSPSTRAAFLDRFVRKGIETGLQALEAKALSTGTPADGGYAVPEAIDASIEKLLVDASPIRAVANVVRDRHGGLSQAGHLGGMVSGWVGETGSRAETGTPTFQEIAPPSGELYANPAASQAMLDDAQFDVEGWLADEIAREFARAEGAAFVTGNGTDKPKGFLTYTTTNEADSVRAFGSLQYIASGAAAALRRPIRRTSCIDLVQALSSRLSAGRGVRHELATLAQDPQVQDSDGAFLWQPGLAVGAPATLLGYPRRSRPKTCPTSRPTASRSPSAISRMAM